MRLLFLNTIIISFLLIPVISIGQVVLTNNQPTLNAVELINARKLAPANDEYLFTHYHILNDIKFNNCEIKLDIEGGKGLYIDIKVSTPQSFQTKAFISLNKANVSEPGKYLREAMGLYQYLIFESYNEGKVSLYFLKYLVDIQNSGIRHIILKEWTMVNGEAIQKSSILCTNQGSEISFYNFKFP